MQPLPLPEILIAKLADDFGFLKTLPLDYPPASLPAVKTAGQLCPIARSELLGLDHHAGIEKLYHCIAPHYPVQIAPEMGITFNVNGLQFSETRLRVYIHSFGLVLSLQTRFEVAPGSSGLTGFALARILKNLERNRGVRAATVKFRQPKSVLDIFYRLRRLMVQRMFADKVASGGSDDVFLVFSPDSGEFSAGSERVSDGQPDRLALYAALERYPLKEDGDAILGNKCFSAEAGSEDSSSSDWVFGSKNGVALFVRPGEHDTHATRARRCYHKNVARLLGWYLLYQAYLSAHAGSQIAGDKAILQHAVNAYDTMAVKYSKIWICWARRRFLFDEPVKAVVAANSLTRTLSPDGYVSKIKGLPDIEVRPVLNFKAFPTALCLAMPEQVESLVTFHLRNSTSDPVDVQLYCELQQYSLAAEEPVVVKPGESKPFEIKVTLIAANAAALKVNENTQVKVRWDAARSGAASTPKDKTFTIAVLQKDYFVSARRHEVWGTFVNCSWSIAAWVSPEDPAMIELRTAASEKNHNSMPGYPEGDDPLVMQSVVDQVKALYDALHDKKIPYGNRTRPQYSDANYFGQTVRLPGKSIADHMMNCLDGAVLFASLLASCDLDPGILFIPGHALVGWKQSNSPASDWAFIDVTDAGMSDFETALESARTAYSSELQERTVEVRDIKPAEAKEMGPGAILVDIRKVWAAGVKTIPA